jgi:hypothetical protein
MGADGLCSKSRGQQKNANSTCQCNTAFVAGQGFVLNPRFERAIKEALTTQQAIAAKLPAARQALAFVLKNPGREVCSTCSSSLSSLTKEIPIVVRKGEVARIQEELKAGPATVARKIANGERVTFSDKRDMGDGSSLTECVVHANDPLQCGCGGWGDWSTMRAMVTTRHGSKAQIFAFGTSCAEAAKKIDPSLKFSVNSFGDELFAHGIIPFKPKPQVQGAVANTRRDPNDLSRPQRPTSKKRTWAERNVARGGGKKKAEAQLAKKEANGKKKPSKQQRKEAARSAG